MTMLMGQLDPKLWLSGTGAGPPGTLPSAAVWKRGTETSVAPQETEGSRQSPSDRI